MRARTDIADLVTALGFGTILGLFALGALFGPLTDVRPLQEKRDPAPRPAWEDTTVRDFPGAWEAWFNDHFPYRPVLVRADNYLNLKLWGESPVRRVLPGRHGWLFYDGRSDRGGDPRRNYRGRLPTGHEELFAALRGQLEHTRDHFAARGIRYLLVVVPDKWSIHAEHLPRSVGPAAPRTSSDLFLDYLGRNSDLAVLDLKAALREAAAQGPVYHLQDTHWNDTGALAGARAIALRLQPDLPAIAIPAADDFVREERSRPAGDLVAMLGLEGWLSETEVRLLPRDSTRVTRQDLPRAPEFPNPHRYPIHTRQDDAKLPHLLMLRDSFGDALIPFMAPAFAEARFLWTSNYRQRDLGRILDEVRPDVVIELRAEKLMLYPKRYYLAPGRRAFQIHPGRKGGR